MNVRSAYDMCNNVCSFFCLGALVGFSNIGDINAHLNAFENSVVKEEEPVAQSIHKYGDC